MYLSISVHVKWGKEKFDVEANTDEMPLLLKAQLFALSGVQPERQKVMAKGVQLKVKHKIKYIIDIQRSTHWQRNDIYRSGKTFMCNRN